MGCNTVGAVVCVRRHRVSVPSTGRSGLQLSASSQAPSCSTSFSTLYGSKWVATGEAAKALGVQSEVSVPSTGRSGLQQISSAPSVVIVPRFSTLYGSKWVATTVAGISSGDLTSFSTLYGSKWVATLTTFSLCDATLVSVPSTGRSGLQHWDASYEGGLFKVSVPSTGRSGLQPWRHYALT